jgi:hypothetical protein
LPSFEATARFRHAVAVRNAQKEEARLEEPVDVRRERDERFRVESEDHRTVSRACNPAV